MKVAALASLLGLVATAQAVVSPQGSNGPCSDAAKPPGATPTHSSCFAYPARPSCTLAPGYTVPLVGPSFVDHEYDSLITYDCGPSQICCLTCHPLGGYCQSNSDCCNSGTCTTDGTCGPPNSNNDPWVEGLSGQRFLFKPKSEDDAWYAAISDPALQVNLKLHSYDGVTEVDPERDFYIGTSIQTFDEDGFAVQSLLVEVRDVDNFSFKCQDLDGKAPDHCLGGGSIDVFVNGVRMLEPGTVETGAGASLVAANVPAACQALAEMPLRQHPQLYENSRKLLAFNFETLLAERRLKNPADCDRFLTSAKRNFGSIYKAPGTKSTLQFATPRLTSVIDFDTHIPTDASVAPMTYRISYFLHDFTAHPSGSEGFIAETGTVRFDKAGQPLMSGKVLKAADHMYRVEGPFGRDFEAKHMPM